MVSHGTCSYAFSWNMFLCFLMEHVLMVFYNISHRESQKHSDGFVGTLPLMDNSLFHYTFVQYLSLYFPRDSNPHNTLSLVLTILFEKGINIIPISITKDIIFPNILTDNHYDIGAVLSGLWYCYELICLSICPSVRHKSISA